MSWTEGKMEYGVLNKKDDIRTSYEQSASSLLSFSCNARWVFEIFVSISNFII
jgi:hypothetical protein